MLGGAGTNFISIDVAELSEEVITDLGIKVERADGGRLQKPPRRLQRAGTESGVTHDGVIPTASHSVLVESDAGKRQAVGDLAVRQERRLRAEHVVDGAVQDVAVLLVEDGVEGRQCHGSGLR